MRLRVIVLGLTARPIASFRHLVFDLDGTLVDTKDDLAEAVNVSLRALGLQPEEPARLWGYVGHGARVLVERALGPERADLLGPALEIFMSWYTEHLLDHAAVYPGLREVVDVLGAEGIVLSVLTNKPEAMSRAVIGGLGLAAWFPRLIGGDTLSTKKPDPTGLLRLVGSTGVPAEATLMVGDSAIDVATGKNAGVRTCGVLWGFTGTAVRDSAPDALIEHPRELLGICRSGLVRRSQ